MGGAQKVIIELANLLSKSYATSIIDFRGENSFYYEVDSEITIVKAIPKRKIVRKIISRSAKLKFRLTNRPYNINCTYKESIIHLVEYLKKDPQDILILSQGELTAVIPEIKKHIPDQIIIAWQHNDYDKYINLYCKPFIKNYIKGLEMADQVVCLTGSEMQKYIKHNPRALFIYNPLTLASDKPVSLQNKNILFCSRLNYEQKGLGLLVEIAKKIKNTNCKIIVAGDGPDRQRLINEINKENLNDKFILKGPLNQFEMVEFFSEGCLFISTSKWEGFGLVITEAMNMGLPVVCFNNNGPNEILEQGEYGILVDKFDTVAFAEKVDCLLENENMLYFYREKSLLRAESFKGRTIAEQWNDLFKKLQEKNKKVV